MRVQGQIALLEGSPEAEEVVASTAAASTDQALEAVSGLTRGKSWTSPSPGLTSRRSLFRKASSMKTGQEHQGGIQHQVFACLIPCHRKLMDSKDTSCLQVVATEGLQTEHRCKLPRLVLC